MKLSNCEKIALEKLDNFSNSMQDNIFMLTGSAGVGKTFTVQEFLNRTKYLNIIPTATTHKAVSVLKKKLNNDKCTTIHSLLALKPKRYKTSYVLKQNKKKYVENMMNTDIVIVDESTMISEEVLYFIFKDIELYGRKYIFVGDRCQLPPVNENESIIFQEFEIDFEMMEIIRQEKDNPIIYSATLLRDNILFNKRNKIKFKENEIGGIIKLNREEFNNKISEIDWKNNNNENKILSWTNANCYKYNKHVNSILGVDKDIPFDVGSTVTFNSAYIKNDEVITNTGTEGVVLQLERDSDKYLSFFRVVLSDNKEYLVLDEKSINEYNKMIKYLISKEKWFDYYKLLERFADLRPAFSLTVHKSQGSTFENVFIDGQNLLLNKNRPEMMKMFYTAITRASKKCYICT